MVNRWYRELPERALWRIVEAPPEKWNEGWSFYDADGCRCLVGHAENWVERNRAEDRVAQTAQCKIPDYAEHAVVYFRFPLLVERFGFDRARRLCQNAAMREILRRQPSPTPEKRERVSV